MKIFYSNPYNIDKNVGKSYNDFIKSLKAEPEDWIVIQDGDICYLTPDWGVRIEKALREEGNNFGLIGCYTNRLSVKGLLHNKECSEDFDIKNHHRIALTYTGEGIEPYKGIIAGFFMAFQVKTWQRVGGFVEKNISCDSIFNSMIKELGLKSGLIRSLYVFHLYRIWAEKEPNNERKHLK